MDTEDIYNPKRFDKIIKCFEEKLDEILSLNYMKKGEDYIIDVLKMYDLAIWKCYGNEIIQRIEKVLLENQELLIPIIKRYFSGEKFDIEFDYICFLLKNFNQKTLILLKDEWIEFVNKYKYDYEYFIDMIVTLHKSKIGSIDELIRITKVEIERVSKEVERLRMVDISNYLDYEEYLKVYVHVNKDENLNDYIKAYEDEWETWKSKYWEKDYAISRLQCDEKYMKELANLLNSLKECN